MSNFIDRDKLLDNIYKEVVEGTPDWYSRIKNALESTPVEDVDYVHYANWVIELHHYFDECDYGNLIFYANVKCSKCQYITKEIHGRTIENPSSEEDWDVNLEDLYPKQREMLRKRLQSLPRDEKFFPWFCPSCGARMEGIK